MLALVYLHLNCFKGLIKERYQAFFCFKNTQKYIIMLPFRHVEERYMPRTYTVEEVTAPVTNFVTSFITGDIVNARQVKVRNENYKEGDEKHNQNQKAISVEFQFLSDQKHDALQKQDAFREYIKRNSPSGANYIKTIDTGIHTNRPLVEVKPDFFFMP